MTRRSKPSHLEHYELARVHSEGGLGRVWMARDRTIGRVVALKELRPEQAEVAQARARFLSEAQITGQLEHPNIVPVYEVGERPDDGRPYYTMRFIDGPTLADAIREEFEQFSDSWPRGRQRLIRALCSVCHAIDHAHGRGIVHRDLKPENILLGPHGELLLLDWGLAKRIASEAEDADDAAEADTGTEAAEDGGDSASSQQSSPLLQTKAGSVMGTIAYMSPEQADGGVVDTRTDIYGLGAILFEILTGRPPHVGADAVSVLAKILNHGTPKARAIAGKVPAELDAICARAMAKEPGARYADVGAMLDDLERWLADEQVSELRDGPLQRAARWVRRHQSQAYAGALASFLVAIIATAAAVLLGAAAERERGLREKGLGAAAQLAARAVAIEIDLRWSVLEAAATDPDLDDWLTRPPGDDSKLQQWIETQFATQAERTLASSWIVMDRSGVQRARAPFANSVGTNYAFRDYFHGFGRDFDEQRDQRDPQPIRAAHRSIVFRSRVTQRNMVAFSVPVLDPADPERVIGVLGMTVELGRFGVLELGDERAQLTALVDVRRDWRGKRGLVLQHAELAEAQARLGDGAGGLPSYYVPQRRVEQFQQLGGSRVLGAAAVDAVAAGVGALPLVEANYRDPVGGTFAGPWLAAFEPVVVRDSDTGWVVVAQEREDLE